MSEDLRMGRKIKADKRARFALALTAAFSVALSSGVITALVYLLLALTLTVSVRPVSGQSEPIGPGVRLQAGIEKEEVDGDLKSAMDIYQKIAADTSAPREVRARALLRLAECEEKLGREAKHVYEKIVRDYADQPVAAQARKRLAVIQQQEHPAPPTTMSVRKIEGSGLGQIDAWSTDGERAVYRSADGNLYFGDLAGRNKRLVFKAAPGDLLDWSPSIDFSKVYLELRPNLNDPATLAVVNIDGTGYRELIHDDAQRSVLGISAYFYGSWDNRHLLLSVLLGKEAGHLWLVSVADGHRRELASTDEGYISKAVFSPDGSFVAYEVMPTWGAVDSGVSRVFVAPVQGGVSHLVYESKRWESSYQFTSLIDWTANGRYLIIRDTQFGKSALFLLPMMDGAATGIAEMVRFGDFMDAFTTASGTLVYREPSTKPMEADVFLASLSPEGAVGIWHRLDLRGDPFPNNNRSPSFSPGGNAVAYLAPNADVAKTDIVLRELLTGQERILYHSDEHLYCLYGSSHPEIFCTSSKNYEKTQLISVAVESGAVQRLVSFDGPRRIIQHSQDDSEFYFSSDINNAFGPITQWDRVSQTETTVATHSNNLEAFAPSSDGRWLVRTKRSSTLSVRPTTGGEWKVLASGLNGVWWQTVISPDSKWIFFHSQDRDGKDSLFRAPLSGEKAERVGDFPSARFSGQLNMSLDGRQILATCFGRAPATNNGGSDLWMLENFVPSASKLQVRFMVHPTHEAP